MAPAPCLPLTDSTAVQYVVRNVHRDLLNRRMIYDSDDSDWYTDEDSDPELRSESFEAGGFRWSVAALVDGMQRLALCNLVSCTVFLFLRRGNNRRHRMQCRCLLIRREDSKIGTFLCLLHPETGQTASDAKQGPPHVTMTFTIQGHSSAGRGKTIAKTSTHSLSLA
jgi:hypothetical protein